MGGQEVSDGIKISIILIILGVLIGTIFTILGFTRGVTQQGISAVENNLNALQLSVYEDYDQKILSGTKVRAALKLFDGQPIALIVSTTAIKGETGDNLQGYNYGALLKGAQKVDKTYKVTLTAKRDNKSYYIANIETGTNNVIQYNTNTLNTQITGQDEFIRTTAKFTAELIKDSTDSIVGIRFTQN